ncbi:hypothetical protein [Bacteriovorax sp. Seq25_V]|uniref:hypothetical protein n=1 Tax=Bacteriovorax sp. Seq25_V TaxID=1201288 RepID=UPI000389E938|nr:hypothetical protein [Bacteriovorax sp. Seq25_V]EQC46831.1 hypothetical protein M900_2585 [Bacteriovorax sp. Seq25_V]
MKSHKTSIIQRIFSSNSGSVLPQIIATSALVGALAVGVLNLTKNSGKVVKYEAQRSLEDKFKFEVLNALRKKSACFATLGGVNVADGTTGFTDLSDGFKVFASTDPAKNDIYGKSEAGQVNANSTAIRLVSMTLNNYAATGAPYRENGAVGYKRAATTVLEIIYEREGNYAASAGNTTQRLDIPLQVVHSSTSGGGTGVITECNIHIVDGTDQRATGLCQSLGGLIDTDGNCRHINVEDDNAPNNDYAATFKGNVLVEESKFNYQPAFPDKNNHLRVEGSVGVGRDPIDNNDDGGELSISRSMVIGATALQPNDAGFNEAGVVQINNSLGVGKVPNAAKGSVLANESVSVGSSFPSDSPVNLEDGDLAVKNSLSVGNGMTATAAGIPGSLEVKKTLYVTSLANPATKPDGAIFIQGANSFALIGDSSATTGAISHSNNSGARGNLQADGFLNIPSQALNFAPTTAAERQRAATMAWVANKVSQTISPTHAGDVAQVMTAIQDETTPNGKGFISICKGMWARNPDPTNFVGGVPSGFSTCDLLLKHCSMNSATDPTCQQIYANTVTSTGNITTTGNGSYITATNGNITASQGNISANSGEVIGSTVKTNNSGGIISLNSCEINNWSSILIGTNYGSCSTRSVSGQCPAGTFGVSATPVYSNWTYASNASRSGVSNSTKRYVSNVNMKCCEMINYKCGTTPVTPPSDGVCGASTNTCSVGSVTGVSSDTYNNYWTCSVSAPATSASCTEPKTTDGVCGASTNTCTAGTFADTTDEVVGSTTVPTWFCNGIGGGGNLKCYSNYPEDGMCPYDENGETHIQSCDGGTLSNLLDNGTFYTWNCLGINGGEDTDCTMYKAACGTTYNTCNDGAATGGTQTTSKWSWYCTGGTVLCEKSKPINAVCSSSHSGCSKGTLLAGSEATTTTEWTWTCEGQHGGSNANCTETRPGLCASTHYSCTTGTSTANVSGATEWTWTCSGSSNDSCSETKPMSNCSNSSAPSISNATASSSGTTLHGGTLSYSCDSGFSGSPSASCNNGSWSASGSCTAVSVCTEGDTRSTGASRSNCCTGASQKYCEGWNREVCTSGSWVDDGHCTGEICVGTTQYCP